MTNSNIQVQLDLIKQDIINKLEENFLIKLRSIFTASSFEGRSMYLDAMNDAMQIISETFVDCKDVDESKFKIGDRVSLGKYHGTIYEITYNDSNSICFKPDDEEHYYFIPGKFFTKIDDGPKFQEMGR